jgi:iron(III) transport system ATP-binding protein
MRFELKRLQRELGITAVYVTHDQVEALAMSNRVAVMRDGVIQQIGRPRDVYESPNSRFVADFIGISNFIDGKVAAREHGVYTVQTAEGELRVKSDAEFPIGAAVLVAARPEHIGLEVGQANGRAPNRWSGRVAARAFLGESVDHLVTVGSSEIRARCDASISIPEPTEVTVTFRQEACSLIPVE